MEHVSDRKVVKIGAESAQLFAQFHLNFAEPRFSRFVAFKLDFSPKM